MTTEKSHLTNSNSEERSGCLRTCLIAMAVLTVVAVLSVAGIYVLGRAYVARQLPVWETRYPAVGLAVDLLELRRDLSSSDGSLLADGGRTAGMDDRSAMPEDLPLYPDPEVETYSVDEEQAFGFQRVAGPPEDVLSRLGETMPQNGWALAWEEATDWGRVLVWEKGERTCQTEVVSSEGDTEIWIRCTS